MCVIGWREEWRREALSERQSPVSEVEQVRKLRQDRGQGRVCSGEGLDPHGAFNLAVAASGAMRCGTFKLEEPRGCKHVTRMWSNRNAHLSLVQTSEDRCMVSYKTKQTLIRFISHAPWYLPKGAENLCPHKNLHMDVYSSCMPNYQNLGATEMSFSRWMVKLWHIQIVEYDSALKKKWAVKPWKDMGETWMNTGISHYIVLDFTVLHRYGRYSLFLQIEDLWQPCQWWWAFFSNKCN